MIDQTLNNQRTCATCMHAHQEQMQGQIMRQLVCHESPPSSCMVTAPGPGGQMGIQGVTMFPVVQPHMFCSRWKSATLHLPTAAFHTCDGEHAAPACEAPNCWHK